MISKITQTIKDIFGSENEFVTSVDIAIKERITSPFYGYFIVSWLFINWKIFYIAFFIGQDEIFKKTGLLRHDYLSSIFPGIMTWKHWLNFLILPFILTCLFFWIFPSITRFFYRQSLRNQIKLKRIEIQETTKQTKEEKKLIQEERNLIKEQVGKAKETKKIEKENPEILWEEDFNRFQNSILFKQFQQILDSIYKHEGHTRVESRFSNSYEPTYDFEINTEILIFADINNLIPPFLR